jgi:hypothetical protein
MKHNLLFGGNAKGDEVCERIVRKFIDTEMKVESAGNITYVNDMSIGY